MTPFRKAALTAVAAAAMSVVSLPAARAQQGDGTRLPIPTHVFKPDKVPATPERIAGLKAPAGFTVTAFATGLKNPRIVAVGPDGAVYVSRREQGDVLMLRDADGDGRADGPPVVVANRPGAHGIAVHGRNFYLVTVEQLLVAEVLEGGRLGPLTMLAGDLPDAGQHPNRTIAVGPDGMLYLSVGSTCNACNESNPEHATMLRVSPDGKQRTIFASGLRNTIGFDWHPTTGELWGMDHGIDHLGDDIQPEELNRIVFGKQYGWPHVWGSDGITPQTTPPGELSKQQWQAMSQPMVLGHTAHAAPMQMLFYRGDSFPAAYRGDAFVAMRGSWNREPGSGYEIVRVRYADGQPTRFEPFVSGFLTDGGTKHFARPVGLAVAKDGALLMADDANGVVYRIAYTGAAAGLPPRAAEVMAPPATAMLTQTSAGTGVALALNRLDAKAGTSLEVTSPSFGRQQAMPPKHSEYADAVSPALEWSAVQSAKSYAIVVEDPDAKPAAPFVHWIAWNIPAALTRLPEGLDTQLRLTEPAGLLQGRTSRGSIGYFGPKPPVGDPPHRYHFQVFALDRTLDLLPGASRDEVLEAMRGRVLAKGETIGTFQQTQAPLK